MVPMATIIPVDYCQANVVISLNSDDEPMICTFGVHAVDETNINSDLADDLMTEFGAAFAGLVAEGYFLEQVVLYGFNGLGPSEVHISTLARIPFTREVSPLPNNCAYLIRKRTDAAGRRGRGRFYLPGVAEANVSPTGVLDGVLLPEANTAAAAFLTGVQALTSVQDMVVLHRSEGLGTEPAPTPVTSLVADTRIATQRRRLRP